jgi:hypothetical protein
MRTAGRPNYFPQSNFLRATYRPGRGQVHKIDARDQEDKNRHTAEDAHVFNATRCRLSVYKGAVQIPVAITLQAKPDLDAIIVAKTRLQQLVQFGRHGGCVCPRR